MAPKTSDAAIYLALVLSIVAALVSTPVIQEAMADVRSDVTAGASRMIYGDVADDTATAPDAD